MLSVHDDTNYIEPKIFKENFSRRNDFVKIYNTLKIGWRAFKDQKKKIFNASMIHKFGDMSSHAQNIDDYSLGKVKHVMFADRFGLDLEMIHSKNLNLYTNEYSCINDINETTSNDNGCEEGDEQIQIDKIILPKFSLNSDTSYRRLIKNGICLNSFEIYDRTSIRGIVLTLQNSSFLSFIENNKNMEYGNKVILNKSMLNKNHRVSYNECDQTSLNLNLDLVYVIWTIDEWKSWKYQAAIQKNCKTNPKKGIIKTHEFFIQNLENILQITQRLKLIVCHQIGLIVFKDTNNEKTFQFDLAIKI
jgi:hypothetical protein